jgi:hypothetical protein
LSTGAMAERPPIAAVIIVFRNWLLRAPPAST